MIHVDLVTMSFHIFCNMINNFSGEFVLVSAWGSCEVGQNFYFLKGVFNLPHTVLSISPRYTNDAARVYWSTKPATYFGWYDVEPAEFYRLLALLMYLGIIQVPSIDKAYSKKSLYNGLWCRAFLVKRRFKQIMCFLKLSNMDNQANSTDKLFKVCLLVEYIRSKSQALYKSIS